MGTTTRYLTKSYTAGAAIGNRRICKAGAADGAMLLSAAATDFHMGISSEIDAASAERVDLYMNGCIAECYAGGNVTRGASVTSDAAGAAVTATTGQRAIGYAEVSGVSGDIITVVVSPHTAA